MRRTTAILGLPFFCLIMFAQTRRVIGEVKAVDAAKGRIELRGDDGAAAEACVNASTKLVRVPPGEKDLAKAAPVTLAEVAAGDRVLALGPCPATRIVVMAAADLRMKQEREHAEWQKRGTAGVVTALDPKTREITLQVGAKPMVRTMVIENSAGVVFRRYPPDSIRFSEARPSSFEELRAGDQVRVLGNRSADGSRITPEIVVSGAFRTLAGIVSSVDAGKSEIVIKDLDTKKPVTVRLTADSRTRRIPEMAATMLANRLHAAAGNGGAPMGFRGAPGGAGRPGGALRSGDFQDMLERFPAFTLAELKTGEAIILSGTKGEDPSQTTAAVVLAGVEPLLRAAPSGRDPLGGAWTFEIGLP